MYVVKFGQAGFIHETILFDIVSAHAPKRKLDILWVVYTM